jgi:hypothetical protein
MKSQLNRSQVRALETSILGQIDLDAAEDMQEQVEVAELIATRHLESIWTGSKRVVVQVTYEQQ